MHTPASLRTSLYPFLFAVYPVLHLYTHNPGQATPDLLVWPIVCSLSLPLLLWLIGWLAMHNGRRASLVAAIGVAAFFGYGYVFPLAYRFVLRYVVRPTTRTHFPSLERDLQWLLAILTVTVLCIAVRWIARLRPETLETASHPLTASAIALLLMAIAPALFRAPVTLPNTRTPERVRTQASPPPNDALPDIYHIVLDGYARQDVLARHFDFDNGPFLRALDQEGFHVAAHSRANFYWTFLSLASMLNMRYVTNLEQELGADARDPTVPFQRLRDSEVARFLKARGYTSVHLASTWVGTMENPTADVQIPCATGWLHNNFYRALVESSMLRIFRSPVTNDIATCHLAQLEALAHVAVRPGPKFVFAHFIPPHHPYIFDRHGNVLRSATIADEPVFNGLLWAQRGMYRDQLIYMNGRVLQVVRTIIATSARPAVVILHSDHGPQLVDASGAILKENTWARFSNLVAIRAPSRSPFVLPADIELVNVYRLLFDHYFGADLPMLAGAQYYSPFNRPYDFERVDPAALCPAATTAGTATRR